MKDMYKVIDGVKVKMTPEEVEEFEVWNAEVNGSHSEPAPTLEDRMVRVEQEVEDLSYVITGEVTTNAQ